MRTELKSVGPGWLGSLIVIALACAALSLWIYSPIYPDEVAFRIARLRFIPDGGMIRGLFAICGPSDLSASAWLRPVAWTFSWLDLRLGAYGLRWLPIGTAIFSVLTVIVYARWFGKAPLASAVLLGLLGVAGSGLVIARFEHVATMSIAVAILCLGIASSRRLSLGGTFGCLLLIVAATAASIFVHPQGFLFLPLSVFAMIGVVRSFSGSASASRAAVILVGSVAFALLLALVMAAIAGLDYCKGSAAMQAALAKMTIQSFPKSVGELVSLLSLKIANYADSLLYKAEYQVNYLPGVVDANNQARFALVNTALLVYVIGMLGVMCLGMAATLYSLIRNARTTGFWRQAWLRQSSVAASLISGPGVMLIVYDNQQYFYRSIFINFIFSIALVLFLIDAMRARSRAAPWIVAVVFAVPLLGTIYFNYKTFYYRLNDWSAIYSMPKKTLIATPADEVMELASQCGIQPQRGGLVVDGSTYDALKHFPNLQVIWYIEYQSTISGYPIPKIIEMSDSPGVIASCSAIERSGVGFPAQHGRGNLCCHQYPTASSGRR